MSLPLPKASLLTKSWEYREVYRRGRRVRGRGLTLIFVDNDQGRDRIGISVGGQKLAVRRNRIKRLLKEYYRHNRSLPSQVAQHLADNRGVDLVIATNQKFEPRGLADIQEILDRHIRPKRPGVTPPTPRA